MNKLVKPFKFAQMHSVEDFREAMRSENVAVPCSERLEVLKEPMLLHGKLIPNRLAIHPCEGFDACENGNPTERIFRRYGRYAAGGAGMIWFEAVAVCEDGRCNPHQMTLLPHNLAEMKRLVEHTNETARQNGWKKPYNILQLTHSGRTAKKPDWTPRPLIAFDNPLVDRFYRNITVASDERIELLEQQVIDAACLAAEAGFDAVDIKLCHNYIMRELLAAYTRPGKFGGSFENRTRFIFDVIKGIRERCGDAIDICTRLNAYDCIPYPYGWGMEQKEGVLNYDITEPVKLIRGLVEHGVRLINLSTMMPRYSPLDTGYLDQFEGKAVLYPHRSTATLLKATREIKQAVPEAVLVATGLSWFSQFGGNVGAGGIEEGWFDFAGFGRQALAYPDFARDLMQKGEMDHQKCCVNCDKCYELIGLHENSGCVVRDKEEYLPLYLHGLEEKKKRG